MILGTRVDFSKKNLLDYMYMVAIGRARLQD